MPVSTLPCSLLMTRSFSASCPLFFLGCHSVPKALKAGAREGGRLGSDRCGTSGLWSPLDSPGELCSSPAPPPGLAVRRQASAADPVLEAEGVNSGGLQASWPCWYVQWCSTEHQGPWFYPPFRQRPCWAENPDTRRVSAVGVLSKCSDCGETIATSGCSFLGHLEPGWEAAARAGSALWPVGWETPLVSGRVTRTARGWSWKVPPPP